MVNSIILSSPTVDFNKSPDEVLERKSDKEHVNTLCTECGHSRAILNDSLCANAARKHIALELISDCKSCWEFFKIHPAEVLKETLRMLAILRTARKHYKCYVSKQIIAPGEKYYQIVQPMAGVNGWRYPDRVLPEFLPDYWKQIRRQRDL